jgi:peptidoglycan LD-endopeptidase CwlK
MASRSLSDAHPALAEKYLLLAEDFANETPFTLLVTCTYRPVDEQQADYAQGRTVPGRIITQDDGVTHLSPHNYNPSHAIDVAVVDGQGNIVWDEAYYHPLVELAVRHGLISGGSWPHFKDWPHLEGPPEMFAGQTI